MAKRGRPRKQEVTESQPSSVLSETVEHSTLVETPVENSKKEVNFVQVVGSVPTTPSTTEYVVTMTTDLPPITISGVMPEKQHVRGADGLIIGMPYKYKNGRVDWEAMFNPEYLVYPGNDYSKTPLMKVDGLRDLAEIRGIKFKKVNHLQVTDGFVAVGVEVSFIANSDDPNGRKWSAVADATAANIGGKMYSKYLTTIAETRAVGRCLREALGIRLCTFEEVCKDDIEETTDNNPINPETIVAIQHQMKLKGIDIANVLKKIQEKHPHISSLNNLTVDQGRQTLMWLSQKQNVVNKA